jgi:hypothetical protein
MPAPTTSHEQELRDLPANENGRRNLAGWTVTCKCGWTAGSTILTNLLTDARQHTEYMKGQGR